jgi:hypothetical protein
MRALTVLLFLVNYMLVLSVLLLFRGVALASFIDKEQPRDVLDTKDMTACPASQVKKNQAHLLDREPLSWFCVSDLLLLIRRELLRAVTLDDSKTPTPVLHNMSVVV